MCDKKDKNQQGSKKDFLVHGEVSERNAHFSMEPAGEKDFDIFLMTGNKLEGDEKK